MNRRDFIVKLPVLFAFPLIISQIGCDSSTKSTNDDTEPMDGGTGNGTGGGSFNVTSSVNRGHSHTVTIMNDDIDSPPTSNKTLNSSTTDHFHQITLSTADYQALKDGGTVVKTSTTNGGHSHTFSIKVPGN